MKGRYVTASPKPLSRINTKPPGPLLAARRALLARAPVSHVGSRVHRGPLPPRRSRTRSSIKSASCDITAKRPRAHSPHTLSATPTHRHEADVEYRRRVSLRPTPASAGAEHVTAGLPADRGSRSARRPPGAPYAGRILPKGSGGREGRGCGPDPPQGSARRAHPGLPPPTAHINNTLRWLSVFTSCRLSVRRRRACHSELSS